MPSHVPVIANTGDFARLYVLLYWDQNVETEPKQTPSSPNRGINSLFVQLFFEKSRLTVDRSGRAGARVNSKWQHQNSYFADDERRWKIKVIAPKTPVEFKSNNTIKSTKVTLISEHSWSCKLKHTQMFFTRAFGARSVWWTTFVGHARPKRAISERACSTIFSNWTIVFKIKNVDFENLELQYKIKAVIPPKMAEI